MEYTKDIIFSVKYNEEKDCLELKNSGKIEKIHNLIKRNKSNFYNYYSKYMFNNMGYNFN